MSSDLEFEYYVIKIRSILLYTNCKIISFVSFVSITLLCVIIFWPCLPNVKKQLFYVLHFQVNLIDVKIDESLKELYDPASEYWNEIGKFKKVEFPGRILKI